MAASGCSIGGKEFSIRSPSDGLRVGESMSIGLGVLASGSISRAASGCSTGGEGFSTRSPSDGLRVDESMSIGLGILVSGSVVWGACDCFVFSLFLTLLLFS